MKTKEPVAMLAATIAILIATLLESCRNSSPLHIVPTSRADEAHDRQRSNARPKTFEKDLKPESNPVE
jgi:hypothetical protein